MKKLKKLAVIFALLIGATALTAFAGCDLFGGDDGNNNTSVGVTYTFAKVNYHYQYNVAIENYWQESYSIVKDETYYIDEFYQPPEKSGYTFMGYTREEGGEGDLVELPFAITGSGGKGNYYNLYAKYEPISYTIVYYLDGGINNPANPLIASGDAVILKNPTKDKHEFMGWYSDPEFEHPATYAGMSNNTDTTVNRYAKWRRVYELNYVSDQPKVTVTGDQSFHKRTSFTEDDNEFTVSLEPEYFENYMFLGWECEEGAPLVNSAEIKIDPKIMQKDITFTARYLQASNPANTEGLRTVISYGRHRFYARENVEKIIVEDKYDKNNMTYDVTVYYSGENPPEVVCREGISVSLIKDPEEVEKQFNP